MSSLSCFSAPIDAPAWTQCYSAPCNIDANFPAMMSDSRAWSSWQPEAVINRRIQEENGIHNNWQYRRFLQANGSTIMGLDRAESCYVLGMNPHVDSSHPNPSSRVPYMFRSTFDTAEPGFGYCNSDLKRVYLSREQLNARLVAPEVSVPVPSTTPSPQRPLPQGAY